MNQGQCTYSGVTIPYGSGIHRVGTDNKVQFLWGKKEASYQSRKVSARTVKWTEISRQYRNKTYKSSAEKTEFIPIQKTVRGFSCVPMALLDERSIKQSVEKKPDQSGIQRGSRVFRHSNVGAGRK